MFKRLSLTGWLIVAGLAVVAFVGLGLMRPTFLGLQFDPFGMDARKIDNLTTERDAEASNGVARGLEVEGERDQAARVDTFHTQVIEVRDFTARAETEVRSAPDANDPLADSDADLFGEHQHGLCLVSARVCRSAAPLPPGGGDDPM